MIQNNHRDDFSNNQENCIENKTMIKNNHRDDFSNNQENCSEKKTNHHIIIENDKDFDTFKEKVIRLGKTILKS